MYIYTHIYYFLKVCVCVCEYKSSMISSRLAPGGARWCGVTKCQPLEVPTQSSVALTCSNRVQGRELRCAGVIAQTSAKATCASRAEGECSVAERESVPSVSVRHEQLNLRHTGAARRGQDSSTGARKRVLGPTGRQASCQKTTPRGGN